MSDENETKEFERWSKKLAGLLQEARDAAQQKTLPPRLEVNEKLMDFVEKSPNLERVQDLDDIATQTASALLRQTIEERLQSITERTGEYQKLAKQFEGIAIEAEKKAKGIRLEAITALVDSATQTVEAAKSLEKCLSKTGADAELASNIGDTLAALERLKESVRDMTDS